MKVRELLQYEIWSKETSRKILSPIGKCLKWVAIVSGSLAVLIWIVYVIESAGWLDSRRKGTPEEPALAQIVELEKLIDCNCDQFVVVDGKAHSVLTVATQKAWTLRDHSVAFELWFYLTEVEQKQEGDLREAQAKAIVQQRHLQWHSNPELEQKDRSLRRELFSTFRLELHKELD